MSGLAPIGRAFVRTAIETSGQGILQNAAGPFRADLSYILLLGFPSPSPIHFRLELADSVDLRMTTESI